MVTRELRPKYIEHYYVVVARRNRALHIDVWSSGGNDKGG